MTTRARADAISEIYDIRATLKDTATHAGMIDCDAVRIALDDIHEIVRSIIDGGDMDADEIAMAIEDATEAARMAEHWLYDRSGR
jgi:hypothetical protein